MNAKKVALTILGVGGTIVTGLLLKNRGYSKTNEVTEKAFSGIPLSKLTELAKQIYHGLYCSIDKSGFLVLHQNSNRRHQTFHTQMTLDETGKLINLGVHYPGQRWSGADEFAKRANELFEFKK